MDKKRKILGLVFTGNENWVGGLYYIVNIIKAIAILPKNKQPKVVLLYNNSTKKSILKNVNFPFVEPVNIDKVFLIRRFFYSVLFRLFKKNYLFRYLTIKYKIQVLYPFNEYHTDLEFLPCEIYYWIFDFQHKFLPELFSKEEITKRNTDFKTMAKKANNIVVSSNTAKKHFHLYYPNFNGNLHVLRFASLIANQKFTDIAQLNKKFGIKEPYFLVSNQFWIHKNHWIILKALKQIKELGNKCLIIFTGKEHDPRNPNYTAELKAYINKNELNSFVKFLGFISREDQLGLMKNSITVIQPSKFEGWGTVVEDAKSLCVPVILSDIDIHREQLPAGEFFGKDDYKRLAKILVEFIKIPNLPKNSINIDDYYLKFAESFMGVVKS